MADRARNRDHWGSRGSTDQSAKKLKVSVQAESGLIAISTEQTGMYKALSYIYRYKEPSKVDWGEHIGKWLREIEYSWSKIWGIWESLITLYSVLAEPPS